MRGEEDLEDHRRGDEDLYASRVDLENGTMEFPNHKKIKIDGDTVALPKMGDLGL